MTEKEKKVCKKYNKLGECIEWQNVGEMLVPVFKKELKECNKELFNEWKKFVNEDRIATAKEP